MTPKEKAYELIEKCDGYACYAEVAVNEIIELYEFHLISNPDDKRVMDTLNYFDEVKKEMQ